MNRLHPYLQIYYNSNKKLTKALNYYLKFKNQNQNAGGKDIKNIIDNFIFEEKYDEEDKITNIFIAERQDCIHAIIDSNTSNLVWVEWFGYHQNCSIDRNLIRGEGTARMMETFIKYIKKHHPEIKYIKLSDNSEFTCDKINISLYKLYILKYGKSFYEKKFDFVLDTTNKQEIINIHNYNIEKSKNLKINKELIKEQFQLLLLSKLSLLKFYLNKELIDNFLKELNDDELVSDFLIRYKIPDEQCGLFEDFLNIIFGNNGLDTSIISNGAVYVKTLDIIKSKKLTKKKLNRY
jgi:hypothetical protein